MSNKKKYIGKEIVLNQGIYPNSGTIVKLVHSNKFFVVEFTKQPNGYKRHEYFCKNEEWENKKIKEWDFYLKGLIISENSYYVLLPVISYKNLVKDCSLSQQIFFELDLHRK